MAKKSSEQVILNRRLKPIYDAVDNANNKKAIEEADRLLKKHPTTHTAKALKALALIRMERNTEAWPLVEEVDRLIRDGHMEENTINEAYVPERIPPILEVVLKNLGPNENLLIDLFNAYARVKDYKNQQRIAQSLSKEFNKRSYVFWTISSITMQALQNPQMGPKVLFPLAQKMIEKLINSSTVKPARSEVLLYTQILQGQLKNQEALDYIHNSVKSGYLSHEEGRQLVLEVLDKGDMFTSLLAESEKMVQEEPFDLKVWQVLFSALTKIVEKSLDIKEEFVQGLIARIKEVDKHIQKVHEQYPSLLIKCMFCDALLKSKLVQDVTAFASYGFGSLLENLKQLVTVAVSKPYCFKEMSRFLLNLPNNDRVQFVHFLTTTFPIDESSLSYPSVLLYFVQCLFGKLFEKPNEEKKAFAVKLMEQLQQLKDADLYIAQAVSLIISNVLWNAYESGHDLNLLQELVIYLEFILKNYPNSYVTALLSIRLHSILGNTNRVQQLIKQLDVKYIQRDSLAHLNFFLNERFGRFKDAIINYTQLSGFSDIASSIVSAYKVGSVDQVATLSEFSQTSHLSLYSHAADVSNRLLSACHSLDSLELTLMTLFGDEQPIEWNALKDTRDFNVLYSFALYVPEEMEKVKENSRLEVLDYAKLRHFLCRTIARMGLDQTSKDDFETDLKVLNEHIVSMSRNYANEMHTYLQSFCSPLIHPIIGGKFLAPLLDILNSYSYFETPSEEILTDLTNSLKVQLTELVDALQGDLQHWLKTVQSAAHLVNTLALTELSIKFLEHKCEAKEAETNGHNLQQTFTALHNVVYSACNSLNTKIRTLRKAVKEADALFQPLLPTNLNLNTVHQVNASQKQSALDSLQDLESSTVRISEYIAEIKFVQLRV